MKSILSVAIFTLIISFNAGAQDCTQAALAQKPGVWKASTLKGSTPNVSAVNLSRERAVVANIHKMVAAAYTPKGVQALYSSSFSGADPGSSVAVSDAFNYTIYLLRYLCDSNSGDKTKSYIDSETPTVVNVSANSIGDLYLYATDVSDNTFRGYLRMRQRPKKMDGFYFLGDVSNDSRGKVREYVWLVTYDDSLPFSYVSRREYLLLAKARLEKTIKNDSSSIGFYDQYVKRINDYLKRSDAELSEPAIAVWNDEERFAGFVAEGTRGSFIAVKHDPAYYKKGLPRSAPQFFTVVYKIEEGNAVPVFEENINVIKKAIDLAKLRNMLGK